MNHFLNLLGALVIGLGLSHCAADPQGADKLVAGAPEASSPRDSFPLVEKFFWKLESFAIDGKEVSRDGQSQPSYIVLKDGEVLGHTGCNEFSARVRMDHEGGIGFAELEKNNNLCPGEMTVEKQLIQLLESVSTYEVGPVKLELRGKKGTITYLKQNK